MTGIENKIPYQVFNHPALCHDGINKCDNLNWETGFCLKFKKRLERPMKCEECRTYSKSYYDQKTNQS
jgi:hypothetical protein